ncbi:MAG TPA: hypothetical protein VJK72_01305 [Candidatus Nanoarchaeia archaeon]|nr:hypothetical protein [Candidatus Nanoarchaeia archaeon]
MNAVYSAIVAATLYSLLSGCESKNTSAPVAPVQIANPSLDSIINAAAAKNPAIRERFERFYEAYNAKDYETMRKLRVDIIRSEPETRAGLADYFEKVPLDHKPLALVVGSNAPELRRINNAYGCQTYEMTPREFSMFLSEVVECKKRPHNNDGVAIYMGFMSLQKTIADTETVCLPLEKQNAYVAEKEKERNKELRRLALVAIDRYGATLGQSGSKKQSTTTNDLNFMRASRHIANSITPDGEITNPVSFFTIPDDDFGK